jgi:hypothetical protein
MVYGIETKVGGDLIVSRSTCPQRASDISELLGQATL